MTIHHDKMAYGKLAPVREDVTEARLAEMLKALNGDGKNEENAAEKEELTKPEANEEK